jgi:hypothetical protein
MPPAKKSKQAAPSKPDDAGMKSAQPAPSAPDMKTAAVQPKPEGVKTAQPVQPKQKDSVDSAVKLIGQAFDFIRANFRSLFTKMLKVEFASVLATLVLWIVFGAITVCVLAAAGAPLSSVNALLVYVLSDRLLLAITAVWLLVVDLAISWISTSISFTASPIVKEQFEGAYSGIRPIFGKIRSRMVGYILLNFIVMAFFLGVPLLLVFLLTGHPSIFFLGMLLFVIYAVAFMLVYLFISQFWRWEVTVGEKQAYEALGASISLVKDNLFGVIVYDIISVLCYIAIAIPFLIVLFVIDLAFQVLGFGAAFVSPLVVLAVVCVSALIRTLITILDTSTSDTFVLPYAYLFWNELRKK